MLQNPVEVANHIIKQIMTYLDRGRELRFSDEFKVSVSTPFDQHKLIIVKAAVDDHLRSNTWAPADQCRHVSYMLTSTGEMTVVCTF